MRYDLPKTLQTKHPNIAQACLQISLDNGGINRGRSVRKWGTEFSRFISGAVGPLDEIEAFLATLSDDELNTLCCGGQGEPEQVALLDRAPAFTDDLLNDYFEKVC